MIRNREPMIDFILKAEGRQPYRVITDSDLTPAELKAQEKRRAFVASLRTDPSYLKKQARRARRKSWIGSTILLTLWALIMWAIVALSGYVSGEASILENIFPIAAFASLIEGMGCLTGIVPQLIQESLKPNHALLLLAVNCALVFGLFALIKQIVKQMAISLKRHLRKA